MSVSYAQDIKPLFSDRDHSSMTFKFEQWIADGKQP